MDRPITTRLPDEFLLEIKQVADKEHIDISTEIRKLLVKAMKDWKIKYALEQYSHGEFSFGQAVKFANVSAWDFPDLLKQHKIPINYDEEEFNEDLKTIGWKKR